MSERVSLPFFTPMFASFNSSIATGLALGKNTNAEIQLLNQITDLSCDRKFLKGYTTPEIWLPRIHPSSIQNLLRYTISLRFVGDYIHEIIHSIIDDGFYAYISNLDDYYLPGKSWYGTKHMSHDGTICGYNDTNGTYEVAAYDMNWNYRLIAIPQESYTESLIYSLEQNLNPTIIAIKAKDTLIKLDVKGISEKLTKYLKSDFTLFPKEKSGRVSGIVVHDYLSMYFEKIIDNSIAYENIDWRPMRAIWEFRVCMLRRIQAIEKELNLDSTLSSQYAPILEETNRLRMLYAVYTKKRKDALLLSVKNGVLSLKDQEQTVLENLISKIEEKI